MKEFQPQITRLKARAESCSRQLRAWADHLQNSDIKGQRHLNDSVRRQAAQKQSSAAFQKTLRASLPPDHPLRRQQEQKESEI